MTTASLLGAFYTGRPAAAPNAISHMLWGKRAFRADRADVSHTVLGVSLNAGAMLGWSAVHELLPPATSNAARAAKAAGITALALVVDYVVMPKRLTPGFEERLSLAGLVLVYAAFGWGLFAASGDRAS